MKTFKFFLASLFLMLCSVASAQQVVVTKTNGDVEVFQPNEVDSVVYKPATKYYYYAGWECPTTEEDLARLAVEPNGACIGTSLGTYSATNVLYDYTDNNVAGTSKAQFYVVIPQGIKIYDADKALCMDPFTLEGTIGNHNIYKSVSSARNIDTIILF